MLKLKKIILFIFVFSCFLLPISPAAAFNFEKESGLEATGKKAGYEDMRGDSIEEIVVLIVRVALSFIGIIFLVLMLYGGFLWMTARGNEEQVTKAKDLITAAIIGLIIVISAYAISYFIMSFLETETLE